MGNILDQDIMYLVGVGPQRKTLLSKELGIHSYGDLLTYYPYKYVDRSKIYPISELNSEMPFVQIKGRILSYEEFEMGARKKRLVAHFFDGTGVVDLVWFHYVQHVVKNYKVGVEYIVFGKPTIYGGRFQFAHPEMEDAAKVQLSKLGLQPYYNTTQRMKNANMASQAIGKLTKTLVRQLPPLPETLPSFITTPLHLVSRDEACRWIHYPKDTAQVQKARIRLKFEELFYVQLNILRYARVRQMRFKGYVFPKVGTLFHDFYAHHLPFSLTEAQKKVMREIRADLCTGKQMNRLLQGDVGSGKTLVALMTMLIALDNGYQACIMAPTEILAEQHLQTICDFLQGMDVREE